MPRRVAVTFILGLDCIIDVDGWGPLSPEELGPQPQGLPEPEESPAPIFAIEGPATARAGERFSLNAWVYLDGHEAAEVLASTFAAEVDEAARTITVTGRVRRLPAEDVRAWGPRIQRALVVGIAAAAPAGEYFVRVPAAYFATDVGLPGGLEPDVPAPCAGWTLRIG